MSVGKFPFGKMSFGKMSFGKVSFGKMSGNHRFLMKPCCSFEMRRRHGGRDCCIHNAQVSCLRWTTVRFDDSFAKFFGSLFVDMCYFSRLPFRWQSTTVEGIIKKGAQAWSNSFIAYRYFQYTGWISFSPCNLLPSKLRKYS